MKLRTGLLIILTGFLVSCESRKQSLEKLTDEQLIFAVKQYALLEKSLPDSLAPRSFDERSGSLITSGTGWWCSGFYPGSLWYLFDYTGDSTLRQMALKRTAILEKEKFNRGTHDLGFMLYCSFGNGLKADSVPGYREILLKGAESLASRFNPKTGCIKSWDNNRWMYPVIIDNMMNLELLMWASKESGRPEFRQIAVSHADRTLQNHFRADNSSFHVVDYDTLTGMPRAKQTAQGYSDSSAWSRGQAWGLYGYTVMYRETRDPRYLRQAENIAEFLLSHPNLPSDLIPYWDLNAPGIPNEPRDASSASIMCSALIELAGFTDPAKGKIYLEKAEKIIRTLSSPAYRAEYGTNGGFLLRHSVGSLPGKSEVDVPLSYADYYFIEALVRMKKTLE